MQQNWRKLEDIINLRNRIHNRLLQPFAHYSALMLISGIYVFDNMFAVYDILVIMKGRGRLFYGAGSHKYNNSISCIKNTDFDGENNDDCDNCDIEDDLQVLITEMYQHLKIHFQQECAPLYLEENTRVSILSLEQNGTFLLAATPSMKQGKSSIVFRLWDSSTVLGFTAREIQIIDSERQITQDGKFR